MPDCVSSAVGLGSARNVWWLNFQPPGSDGPSAYVTGPYDVRFATDGDQVEGLEFVVGPCSRFRADTSAITALGSRCGLRADSSGRYYQAHNMSYPGQLLQ
jgi:hypothetical protein